MRINWANGSYSTLRGFWPFAVYWYRGGWGVIILNVHIEFGDPWMA
jgi:hypothetical protein